MGLLSNPVHKHKIEYGAPKRPVLQEDEASGERNVEFPAYSSIRTALETGMLPVSDEATVPRGERYPKRDR